MCLRVDRRTRRFPGRRLKLFNVVERVLRDVADARVRVLPDRARRGLDLARQALDERRFTSTIGTDARDATGEGHLDRRLLDRHLIISGVLEGHVDDLNQSLALGLDACARKDEIAARASRRRDDGVFAMLKFGKR